LQVIKVEGEELGGKDVGERVSRRRKSNEGRGRRRQVNEVKKRMEERQKV
jgi:hypothetical protein